jgi:hypothetical protein
MIPTFAVRFANFISSDPSLSACKETVVWVLTLIGFGPPNDEMAFAKNAAISSRNSWRSRSN